MRRAARSFQLQQINDRFAATLARPNESLHPLGLCKFSLKNWRTVNAQCRPLHALRGTLVSTSTNE
jgi:hypothetical protein